MRFKVLIFNFMLLSMLNVNGQTSKHSIVDSIGVMDSLGKNGLWVYYYNRDRIAKTEAYVNGKLNGDVSKYTLSGHLYQITQYVDNKRTGWESLFVNGKLERIQYYIDDKVDSIIFDYENGRLSYSAEITSGNVLNGEYITYYKNGQINSISLYSYDYFKHFVKMYYKTGHLRFLRDCTDPNNCRLVYYKKNGEIKKVIYSSYTDTERIF